MGQEDEGGPMRFEIQRNNNNGMSFDDEASLYFVKWSTSLLLPFVGSKGQVLV